jgi:hypothetical protein
MIDELIIDNDNDWNGNKTRTSEKHELVKPRFKNYNKRSKDVNVRMRYDINICEKKMENEFFFKKHENFFI